jgi:riboflavin kinase/FMN adenylyltransferase
MDIWRAVEAPTQKFHNGVLTVGNFDGLHLGHQSLLKKMTEFPGPRIVITFDPHPLQVLQPERGLKRLFPREDLWERLPAFGVDLLLLLRFDKTFARQRPDGFLDTYVGPFHPKHVVAGYDFAFGAGRAGNLDSLRAWCAGRGVQVDVMPPLELDGVLVSSRKIRECIEAGEVGTAATLLGRPFYLRGAVGAGAGRGAAMGFPTLNQSVENETLPKGGVYATRVRRAGRTYASVTNIGTNPTFESGSAVKVETFVLDQKADWRGERIDVELIERLRDEKKFSGVEDLKEQIQADILNARKVLDRR